MGYLQGCAKRPQVAGEPAWMMLCRAEASREACVTRVESSCSVRSPRPFVRALTLPCDGTWPRVMVHTRRESRVTAPDAPRHIYPRQPHIPGKRWLGIFLDGYHGFDHGVGHPLLFLCDAKVPSYRKNNGLKDLGHYSEWPKVADAVIKADTIQKKPQGMRL
jgi:hypothetical protein